jgi:trk system potassium uptake protein TrkA
MNKKQVGIIGLGKFGTSLGKKLVRLGHEVIGLDRSDTAIQQCQDIFTQVYRTDAIDKTALQQVGFAELPMVIVCVGQNLDSSILIALHLVELGIPNIWVKAISSDHEKILNKIGVHYVIFPEQVMAEQLAYRINTPGLLDMLPYWEGVVLQELVVDKWSGKMLKDINMINQYMTQVVAIRKAGQSDYQFVPRGDRILNKGDILVVIGKDSNVSAIKP